MTSGKKDSCRIRGRRKHIVIYGSTSFLFSFFPGTASYVFVVMSFCLTYWPPPLSLSCLFFLRCAYFLPPRKCDLTLLLSIFMKKRSWFTFFYLSCIIHAHILQVSTILYSLVTHTNTGLNETILLLLLVHPFIILCVHTYYVRMGLFSFPSVRLSNKYLLHA